MKILLCAIGLHAWQEKYEATITTHRVFGEPDIKKYNLKQCLRCNKWNINPAFFGININWKYKLIPTRRNRGFLGDGNEKNILC